jgi:hypothetical protein
MRGPPRPCRRPLGVGRTRVAIDHVVVGVLLGTDNELADGCTLGTRSAEAIDDIVATPGRALLWRTSVYREQPRYSTAARSAVEVIDRDCESQCAGDLRRGRGNSRRADKWRERDQRLLRIFERETDLWSCTEMEQIRRRRGVSGQERCEATRTTDAGSDVVICDDVAVMVLRTSSTAVSCELVTSGVRSDRPRTGYRPRRRPGDDAAEDDDLAAGPRGAPDPTGRVDRSLGLVSSVRRLSRGAWTASSCSWWPDGPRHRGLGPRQLADPDPESRVGVPRRC